MTEESEFLGKFEGVQQSGGGWVARCPAHGDDNPSLSIARGEDGRWLVHCHAGCTAEQVVEAVGLKMRDLMPDRDGPWERRRPGRVGRAQLRQQDSGGCDAGPAAPRAGNKTEKRWGKWVCDYVYTDEKGAVLYKSCRYVKENGKKTFVIKAPDPGAPYGWSFGLSKRKIPRVPYRLTRVARAAKEGKTIVIVEGEKDVLSVEKAVGCAATCNVGGAMKWGYGFPEDWIKWFKGAGGIIIVADNDPEFRRDEKTGELKPHWRGQKHAWDVRARLIGAGFEGKIKLMVMPPVPGVQDDVATDERGRSPAGPKDFTDWVEARKAAGSPGRGVISATISFSPARR